MKYLAYFTVFAAILCLGGVALTLRIGSQRFTSSLASLTGPQQREDVSTVSAKTYPTSAPFGELTHKLTESWPLLLAQLATIVLATWIVTALLRRIGLPSVVGEIMAGIILGPTFLGWFWPDAFNLLFYYGSLDGLKLFGQIGVTVFMFIAGAEFKIGYLRGNVRRTVFLSQIGILLPFLFGTVAALFLYGGYAGEKATFAAFALFIAISMSITAFPVLIRMLEERRMSESTLGVAALACAAIDDVSAWTILSIIVAFVTAHSMGAIAFKFCGLIIFVMVTWHLVRPALVRWLTTEKTSNGHLGNGVMAVVLLYMILSALTTELLGVHALFGAFIAGVCLPRKNRFCEHLALRLEGLNGVLFLPPFFALSGLRTQLGSLDGKGWIICGIVILVATVGKWGGCMTGAKLGGMQWRDAIAFGALMNTRGLMELIVINIGRDLGIFSPSMFSILVVMALVTTILGGQVLTLTERYTEKSWQPIPIPGYFLRLAANRGIKYGTSRYMVAKD